MVDWRVSLQVEEEVVVEAHFSGLLLEKEQNHNYNPENATGRTDGTRWCCRCIPSASSGGRAEMLQIFYSTRYLADAEMTAADIQTPVLKHSTQVLEGLVTLKGSSRHGCSHGHQEH